MRVLSISLGSLVLVLSACDGPPPSASTPSQGTSAPATTPVTAPAATAPVPGAQTADERGPRAHPFVAPAAGASASFWERWGDGRAELASYRGTVMRYGAPRDAELVLVYVTEPLDRRTLIKDDAAPAEQQLPTLKLNAMLRFQTGIYPYSVMTSTFAPLEAFEGLPRFTPAKITLTSQDWCGHVFTSLWREGGAGAEDALALETRSYFAETAGNGEGDSDDHLAVPRGVLHEEALFVQLRELDGRAFDRPDEPATAPLWTGSIVPSLWSARRDHRPLAAEPGEIRFTREAGLVVFVVTIGARTLTLRVTDDEAHTLASWESSDGDRFTLAGSQRLPYWELHDPGEESAREELGLPRGLAIEAPPAR